MFKINFVAMDVMTSVLSLFEFDNCKFNPWGIKYKNKINNFIFQIKYSSNIYHTSKCYDKVSDSIFIVNPFKFFSGNYYATIQKMYDRQDAEYAFIRFDPITHSKNRNIEFSDRAFIQQKFNGKHYGKPFKFDRDKIGRGR